MERINRHRCFLLERIDPDNGLLIKLISFSLPIADIDSIKSYVTVFERNNRIIDVILRSDEYIASFLKALSLTEQQHLVNYLKTNGENVENTDDWPLTCRETKLINTNYVVLTKILDADDLVNQLYSKSSVTTEQMQVIKSKPTDLKRNEALLEILRSRSLRDYNTMISILRESKGDRAANILEGKETSSIRQSDTATPGKLLLPELVWSLETGTRNSIWGVAYLNNFIYVISKHNKLILAFNAEVPFSLSTEIPLPRVAVPRDLAACKMLNCLYVVDDRARCIWKITCTEFHVSHWLAGIGSPFKISITKSGSILIPREGRPCLIELFGSDAKMKKSIELPCEIKDLQYAIESPNGTFVISYGRQKGVNHGILEVSIDGQFLKTHFLPVEIGSKMTDPRHMAFARGDLLFVTDCRSDRVIAFDSQLRVRQILLNNLNNSLHIPYRVCYIEEKRYIIVVHSFGYRVVVYKCK